MYPILSYSHKLFCKIINLLIPILVKYQFVNLLSILLSLNIKKIRSLKPLNKIKYRVLILSKSGGTEDLIASQKRYNKHIIYYNLPRSFITKIYNTIFENNQSDVEKFKIDYRNFLIKFLTVLKKKNKLNALIGFNFNFTVEIELHYVCSQLKIPFLLLYKESVITETEEKYFRYTLQKTKNKFNGYKIAVYSSSAKKNFSESNFLNKNLIEVVGCSRLNESYSFKKKEPRNQILYYAIQKDRGLPNRFVREFGNNFFNNLKIHKQYNSKYNWNKLHSKTLKILKKFAINNPKTLIIIKVKTGTSQNSKEYLNLPKNIKLQFYGTGHQLLENSKVVIAWNTTAILEGIAANRFILIPYFESRNKSFKKRNELILKLKNESYGFSENDFYRKLSNFLKRNYNKNKINNNQFSLKYYLNNKDKKADFRLNRFLNKNIHYKK